MKIAVLGSGGWGTALAMLLAENGHTVTLWSYLEEESRRLQQTRENPLLPGVTLPESLSYTWDLSCVRGCGVVVMATPSFGVRSTAEGIRGMLTPETILVSVSKGIEKGSSLRMTEIIRQATGDLCPVVALSGPSHAEEVARRVPTAGVSACPDQAAAETVQDLFLNDRFRVYSSSDVVGVELGAALKNVMALCTGCCTGMGYGDNTKAMLMTRGLAETARLGVALGGRRETFAGLAGMGDLIVTCTSMNSRNYRAGILIGQGPSSRLSRRSAPWWRATTPWTPPGSWPSGRGWRCPSPRPPTRCSMRDGTPRRCSRSSCAGKSATRWKRPGSDLSRRRNFQKSAK